MNTEQIHKETGKIIELKDKIESLKSKLDSLKSTGVVSAKLTVEINYNKRGSSMFWLNAKEVEEILYSRMREAESELVKIEAMFKN